MSATDIVVARAENAKVWDADGREYIDFAGGIGVLNTGHRHPHVIKAVRTQLDCFTHSAFQVAAYEPYVELAERLNALVPIEGPRRTIFFTTGAEAVENAVKIARAATGRSAVIAFTGAFHGRTALTMAMTGKAMPYKQGLGAPPAEVFHVPFPIARYCINLETSLNILDHILRADVSAHNVAAIIIEPIQGEGGFHIAPPLLMKALRKICDKHGIILIADEVQSGFARTGKMFAMEHYEVKADLITMAKSLAGGFPLSAVSGNAAIMNKVEPGGLGGTYGGWPVGCAAALGVLDVIVNEHLCARAETLGQRAADCLEQYAARNDLPAIAAIRRLGSMVAFDLVAGRGRSEPDGSMAGRLTKAAVEQGLLLLSCGVAGETIRLLYPLTIEDDVFAAGFDRLARAMNACVARA